VKSAASQPMFIGIFLLHFQVWGRHNPHKRGHEEFCLAGYKPALWGISAHCSSLYRIRHSSSQHRHLNDLNDGDDGHGEINAHASLCLSRVGLRYMNISKCTQVVGYYIYIYLYLGPLNPCEDKWGATCKKSSSSGQENWD
jgi:hypothetical protein